MKKKIVESVPPDNLRCKRTDGRKWRCKRRVMDDNKYCQLHYHKLVSNNKKRQLGVAELTSPKTLDEKSKKTPLIGDDSLPDHLRCNKTDGRNWRCKRRIVDNMKLCEFHRHGSLKDFKIRSRKKKKQQCMAISEALDEALKKMKLKKGDLQLELIRMFLRRQMERRKERDYEANCRGDLMKVLPNGLMAISPALSPSGNNVGPFCEVKIGVDSGCFTRRCFRSKNIEPLPVGPLKEVPFAKNLTNVQRVVRNNSHWCFKRGYRSMIKGCEKHYFCEEERCLDPQKEVKVQFTCSCEACLTI